MDVIVKRVLCLANSRKLSGRCIAGVLVGSEDATHWVRPVSAREHQEVSEYERQYENGSDPSVLDIIDVPLITHQPRDYQQENWLLSPDHYWERRGSASLGELDKFLIPNASLWIDGYSTSNGLNDKIPIDLANELRTSLVLIHVESLILSVFESGLERTKRRVQARFRYNRRNYGLWVTDPRIEREYLARDNGHYQIGSAYLTVSLGEAFQGACYKLVAAVIKT